MKLTLFLILFLQLCILANSARILAVFSSPSISHQKMFQSLWWELALRGHNVTAASPNIIRDKTLQNMRQIDLHHAYDTLIGLKPLEFLSKNCPHVKKFLGYFDMMQNAIVDSILDKDVQELLRSNEKFDVIILQAVHPLLFALAYRFKAPVIGKLLNNTNLRILRIEVLRSKIFFAMIFYHHILELSCNFL